MQLSAWSGIIQSPVHVFPPYSLSAIDTRNTREVANEVITIAQCLFPAIDLTALRSHFDTVEEMFSGRYKDYQAMDTSYHDLDHTMQTTLCFIRLMERRHLAKVTPRMNESDLHIGLVAILLHDVGYLKKRSDHDGTGAKFTFVHERRSCEIAKAYLSEHGWPEDRISAVQNLIRCTGPRSVIDSIPFNHHLERIMGEAICTSDYLGQMSDPKYVEKLPVLFEEFEESDDYRGVAAEGRAFTSFEDLLRKTPAFWEKIVLPKLRYDCHGLFEFLRAPYPDGTNHYIDAVEQNIERVRAKIERLP